MRRIILSAAIALIIPLAAIAGSSINPAVPAQNSPMSSAPIRSNFLAAYTDINSILGKFSGSTSPPNPSQYQDWLDTSASPSTLKIYDGVQWVSVGKLNTSTHTWNPTGSYAGTPIAPAYGGLGADFSAATGAVYFVAGAASAGTLPGAYLPNPAVGTLGGVKSLAAVSHNFLTSITTGGLPVAAQPSVADLSEGYSGSGAVARTNNAVLVAPQFGTIVNTGTLTLPNSTDTLIARNTADTLTSKSMSGASNTFTSIPLSAFTALGTTATVLHGNASGSPTFGAVSLTADVSGNLPLANMASIGANTLLGQTAAGTPLALSIPNCSSGSTSALQWGAGTGFSCNSSITANSAANLTGGAAGSHPYQTGSGVTAMLAAGSSTQVLHSGTTPSWGAISLSADVSGNLPLANIASISANTVLGALTATTPSALSLPSCSSSSNALLWTSGGGFSCNSLIAANTAGTSTNIASGAAGQIPYQSGSATTAFAAAGSAGQILRSGGTGSPTWSTATYPATAGTSGNFLKSDGTNISSAAITSGDVNAISTNSAQAAGKPGQLATPVDVAFTVISVTSGTPFNIGSTSLTAGNWACQGNVAFNPAATTQPSTIGGWISQTSASFPTPPGGGVYKVLYPAAFAPNDTMVNATGVVMFSLSGTTTVYLSGIAYFTVSTMTAGGHMECWRPS